MRVRTAAALIAIVGLLAGAMPAAEARTSKRYVTRVSLGVAHTPDSTTPLLSLYGRVSPARQGVKIAVQIHAGNGWRDSRVTATTTKSGTWTIRQPITTPSTTVNYRVLATYKGSTVISQPKKITIKSADELANLVGPAVDRLGPGGRVWGMDISRWDHPGDAPINFQKMYAAGIRFVIIKASDTNDDADARAARWMPEDRVAAQAAGIYTGFYHYSYLPNSTDPAVITADATAQALKAVGRLASVGGYTDRDLPYALDLEESCVAKNSAGTCTRFASKANITLWATTWLRVMKERTGRAPMVYASPSFIERNLERTPELRQYPLWLAHYGVSPHDPVAFPGQKVAGCYIHAWTNGDCSAPWTIWQYSSCAKAVDYGIQRSSADINVFRGTPEEFLALTSGTWVPQEGDYLPVNDPTVVTARITQSRTTDDPLTIAVDVMATRGPAFTGSLKVVLNLPEGSPAIAPIVTVSRQAMGTWTLKATGIPAGSWTGQVTYSDSTGVYAAGAADISFTLAPGTKPISTPKPTASATPKPVVTVTPTTAYKPTPGCGG
jgi:GH25 family lysozyme M1 (1,4-beta-N-acetylmuramidase)